MSKNKGKSGAGQMFGDIAPKFVELSDEVLFGDIWERPELSPRDRSLITCAALIVLGRSEQQPHHFQRALNNGLTIEQLSEAATHLAFYSGWPTTVSALARLKELRDSKK